MDLLPALAWRYYHDDDVVQHDQASDFCDDRKRCGINRDGTNNLSEFFIKTLLENLKKNQL